MLSLLQRKAFAYFLDNQLEHGLVLDRQRNRGRRKYTGLCSTSATGMGLIALALASSQEHALISRYDARTRIKRVLRTSLQQLASINGMLPHFADARTLSAVGTDAISTIDSAWLFAGALWAAEYFSDDPELVKLANTLYERVDWTAWLNDASAPLLHHGADIQGRTLPSVWDRYNAETAFMYVLGIGAPEHALPASSWFALDPAFGKLGDRTIISADLGLFVFQYSLELLDICEFPQVAGIDMLDQCVKATRANYEFCRQHRGQYQTYQTFWGLSAGDGPCEAPCTDAYRAYSPADSVDGTAHVTATLASIGNCRQLVMQNVAAAAQPRWKHVLGRYGYSNINVDRGFVSRDVVGIDIGAALLALENTLYEERVRRVFMRTTAVRRALRRLNTSAR